MIFVCPKPLVWYQAFKRLHDARVASGRLGDEPPWPLLLSGWIYSSDLSKQERWSALVKWAEQHALSRLIPQLAPEDQYCTKFLSTSYPQQHYRLEQCAPRERPSDDALNKAMLALRHDWATIAGAGLAEVCEPAEFTGLKARRLLVIVTKKYEPPWGSWIALSYGPERKTFTEFRRRVNEAIEPVGVDHIDFRVKVSIHSR